ncbi:hypothetical protein [Afipia felis]|uniref:hypothetical protein n=1 Tax=Afipia felis TaxID=1035 RepID=UPI00065FC659|nr:hypothetical protein [Afipia felis]
MKKNEGAYSDTQINDAWELLFRASSELQNLIRRTPAQVIDFQREKEKRMAHPILHEERNA